MLRVKLLDEDRRTSVHTFESTSVTIGRKAGSDLVLDDRTVSREHARLEVVANRCRISDLGSTLGTRVDGTSIERPTFISPTTRIQIGSYELAVTLEAVRDPVEDSLLAAIAAGDDASRAIYADWLEAAGDLERAELLRLQERGLEYRADIVERLEAIDEDWWTHVARAPIAGCTSGDICPTRWEALETTADPGLRRCAACHQDVRYCRRDDDARAYAHAAQRVALDVRCGRR